MEKRYSNGCSDLLLDIRFVHFIHLLTSSSQLKRTDLVSNRQEVEKKETPSSHQRKPPFTTKEASLEMEERLSLIQGNASFKWRTQHIVQDDTPFYS